jgi:hypothetical protein
LSTTAPVAQRSRASNATTADNPAARDALPATDQGRTEVLTAFCATDSVREAAVSGYRHLGEVAAWLAPPGWPRPAGRRRGQALPLNTVTGRRGLGLTLVPRHPAGDG